MGENVKEANRIQGMVRSIDQYRNGDQKAVAAGSHAQILFALEDSRHDILVLWGFAVEAARQAEALQRENAEKDARIAALEEAITTSFCVVYLHGRNEHGTHVLPVFPTSINEEADDISEQAEAIMAAAEAEGFETEDLVWAEFASVPPQIGDEGRIELAGYWEFRGINAEMSELMNRRARALLGGENAE